jgi:ribosomal protein RSM22 (predicted rRNA methylase)
MYTALQAAVEALAATVDRRALARAAEHLSATYRENPQRPTSPQAEDAWRLAYLVTRFPATLAALQHAAVELCRRVDLGTATSVLELGCGPGPARWAFSDLLPGLRSLESVDADPGMLAIARQLADRVEAGSSVAHSFTRADLARWAAPPADIVVLCYALGEISPAHREHLVAAAWDAAGQALVIVEPGTSAGCQRVLDARRWLARNAGRIVAPCPHDLDCPMTPPDWCHFAVRLERTRLHRQLKGATLGYEDEKFSYVMASRHGGAAAERRIVGRPVVRPGHVVLRLCEAGGLVTRTVSRRQGDAYRHCRHARWGEAIDLDPA